MTSTTALDGMRILDLTQYEAGTSCTQALAWLGADVVKVERPGSGDPGRGAFDEYGFEDSEYFLNWNSNKRSVTLALDQPRGRELLLEMAERFDVFVENFGPGVIEKLGLGADVLRERNPKLIYASIKGFGASGPYSEYKCFDSVAQAAGGALSVTGDPDGPPVRPGATIGDSGTGMQMALAIVAAYVHVLRTGEGQVIELSMQEAVTYYLRTTIALGSRFGSRAARRQGNGIGALVNLYPCRPFGPNDYLYIMALAPRMWTTLCDVIGRPELVSDERFASSRARLDNRDELQAIVTEWTRGRTKQEAMTALASAGVPASAVFDTKDLFDDPHLNERGFVKSLQRAGREDVKVLGWPARMSKSSVEVEPAPLLGWHNDEVLVEELGFTPEELDTLRAQGVIGSERLERESTSTDDP